MFTYTKRRQLIKFILSIITINNHFPHNTMGFFIGTRWHITQIYRCKYIHIGIHRVIDMRTNHLFFSRP